MGRKLARFPITSSPETFFLPGNRFLAPTDMEAIKKHLAIFFNIIKASGDQRRSGLEPLKLYGIIIMSIFQ